MKKNIILHAFLLYFFFLTSTIFTKNIKLLVLVIASDQFPIYQELQKKWRSYMHYNPQQVKVYFLKGNPTLENMIEFNDDVIWAKANEGWSPYSAGIINKTILSLEALLPVIDNFDYILRTNLSSFYIFPRLLDFLGTLPQTRCYCGPSIWAGSFVASGCGFIISPDVARFLVNNKHEFLDHTTPEDDVLIGNFLQRNGIQHIDQNRTDITAINLWNEIKEKIPSTAFHFRLKNPDNVRLTDELYIQSQLIEKFYNPISSKKINPAKEIL